MRVRAIGLGLAALAAASLLGFHTIGGAVRCGEGWAPTRRVDIASYCRVCVVLLRTFARDEVARTLEAAATPDLLLGEVGWPWGGRFPPHRTHRAGLSVDLMVPLAHGFLPTGLSNRFGYDESFDSTGHGIAGRIDFQALARQLVSVENAARAEGGRISRVFFAPDLQPALLSADRTGTLAGIAFNKRPSWVRHDDHVHVDFDFQCP